MCQWLPNVWICSIMLVTDSGKVMLAATEVAWCCYRGEMEKCTGGATLASGGYWFFGRQLADLSMVMQEWSHWI